MHLKIFLRNLLEPRGSLAGATGIDEPRHPRNRSTDDTDGRIAENSGIRGITTSFFLKVVEAQIEWAKNAKAEVADLVIHQGMNIKLARTMEPNAGQSKP